MSLLDIISNDSKNIIFNIKNDIEKYEKEIYNIIIKISQIMYELEYFTDEIAEKYKIEKNLDLDGFMLDYIVKQDLADDLIEIFLNLKDNYDLDIIITCYNVKTIDVQEWFNVTVTHILRLSRVLKNFDLYNLYIDIVEERDESSEDLSMEFN